jgi:uncharacterized membrane protein YdjX (TVP38/TMEM64 family)
MLALLRRPGFRFGVFVAILLVMIFSGKVFTIDKKQLDHFFAPIPIGYSIVIFLILYVASDFINWVLKDMLKVLGAIIFGAYVSSLLIYISEIINACIFFRMSTYLGRDFLDASLKGRSKKLYENLGSLSFAWIILLRMVPLIPFRIMDMAFGLSKVSFRKYITAVVLASPLRIFWIQFILASLTEGFSIHSVSSYLAKNPFITYATCVYFIIACVCALLLRKKFK